MSADTLPGILKVQKEKYGSRKVAMRKKDLGIWKEYTWNDVYENVKWASLGLGSIGCGRGDNIAIIGESDPQWYWAEYAAQASGGTATGIYASAHSEELLHLLRSSKTKVAFVRGQEQVDNICEIRDRLPTLMRIVYWVDSGLQRYSDPMLISFDALQGLGRKVEERHPDLFDSNLDRGRGEQDAVICYTQGAGAGLPSPIVLSHDYLIKNCSACFRYDPWFDTGILVSYVSPTSAMDQIIAVAGVLCAAVEISFPEGPDTFDDDVREMGPHYLLCAAPFWERLVKAVEVNMSRASKLKKALYDWSLATGYTFADYRVQEKTPSLAQKISWTFANLLVLRPLRRNLGIARVRSAYQGGAFLSPECLRYLHGIGVNLKQLYAHSECGVLAMHRDGDIKFGTVGPPTEEGTVEMGGDGEILYRRRERPVGKHEGAAADAEITRQPRPVPTGDMGVLDRDGHLILLGRKEEVFKAKNGTVIALQGIEAKLRSSPYIAHAVLIGGGQREFVSAIVSIDYKNVGEWARRQHITYASYLDLSQKDQTYQLVEQIIGKINRELAEDVQIKRFLNFHKDLDVDDGELTRSGNLRRSFIEQHLAEMIHAIYSGKDVYEGDSEIKYRDGRSRAVRMSIQIRSCGQSAT